MGPGHALRLRQPGDQDGGRHAKDSLGLIADITRIIKDFDIDIHSIVTIPKDDLKTDVVLRLNITDPSTLVEALESNGYVVSNIMV
ncbi:MAG: ACT domain-containing protein [Candidatus Syntrophopropionicum ammoniitolerans]